jgi:1A family penicillin-binding protein
LKLKQYYIQNTPRMSQKQKKNSPAKKASQTKSKQSKTQKDWIDKTLPDPIPGSFHAKHPRLIRTLTKIFYPLINPYLRYGLLILLTIFAAGIIFLIQQLPSPQNLAKGENYAVSTLIYDRHGTVLYEIYADENRIPVDLESLPDHVKQATLAIEDKNFYHHFGLDVQGLIRAMRNNLTSDNLEGGSTITQQLVKNALLTSEKSLSRKVKEAILAIMTEIVYSKDEILEMYLNYISYGGTSVGIEAAAQAYFDKSAQDLNVAEASLLAGLPQAPSLYSPFGSQPEHAKERQAEVLRRMVEEGFITQLEAEQAASEPLNYALSRTEIKAPHFVFYVRDWLYDQYGVDKVEKGGLRVYTTLDLNLQQQVQTIVHDEIKQLANYRVGNGAALVTKPNTGEILAMVGSKDYFATEDDGQVNVTLSLRQPGSSIKPLMYATTFQEKTLNPSTLLLDVPTCFDVAGQKLYCPRNYSGDFKGIVTVRQALGNSLNIPAVKSLATIGVETFMNQAKKMGITTWDDPTRYGLSLTLGGGEVKMIDMAQAFGTLANQGVKVPLTPILKIEDYKGEVIQAIDLKQRQQDLAYLNNYESSNNRKGNLSRVMDRAPAYLVSHIMQDNQARAQVFGTRSALVIPDQIVSAKTGTTNDLKDNWTIGFTPEFLTVTWVGNNDGTPMSRLASGVMGAAPMFNDIMTLILENQKPIWQEKPSDVASGGTCANGMPPQYSDKPCQVRNTDLYWTQSKPSDSQFVTQKLWIDPNTGHPPPPNQQVDGLVLEEKTMLQDPVTSFYCYDCNQKTDESGKPIYSSQTVKIINGKVVKENAPITPASTND